MPSDDAGTADEDGPADDGRTAGGAAADAVAAGSADPADENTADGAAADAGVAGSADPADEAARTDEITAGVETAD